jgi:transposase
LDQLQGKKVLTFEETTTSQWLYTELKGHVDEIVVCDAYRNKLLSEGPKTDKIDATKLVQLLKANLLKPVFHSGDEFFYLRKIVSGYEDVVKAGVRLKNQRSALFRAQGKGKSEKTLENPKDTFVLDGIDRGILAYEEEKQRYEKEFHKIWKSYPMVKNLETLPGVGEIGAVKIAAIVVDARRFADRAHFLSYCGLIRLDRISGGKSYGSKKPRCCPALKGVFKTAALSVILPSRKSFLSDFFVFLVRDKNYSERNARNAVARRIAVLAYGIMKSNKPFDLGRIKCSQISL